jgi:hypothetical protein
VDLERLALYLSEAFLFLEDMASIWPSLSGDMRLAVAGFVWRNDAFCTVFSNLASRDFLLYGASATEPSAEAVTRSAHFFVLSLLLRQPLVEHTAPRYAPSASLL